MTIEDIQKSTEFQTLIAECTAYDYKESLEEKKPKSWLKSVSALVDNDGNVKGLDDIQHVTETISMKIRDYMDPLPDVEMIPLEQEGKHVLQLKVKEGLYTPYYYVGDGQRVAFVRNGDESLPATAEQMVRLVLKGTNRTYDSLRTDKRVEDYSFAILANTFKERVQQEWDKKYLLSFGLVTDDGYLTNAGALFADDCWLSQSRLYCTRWYGLEKSDAINDAEYKGNILLLLREAMNFVKSNTKKGWEKLPDGRKNKPEYAERAVLEAMVNHFIHRDYTVMGGEVHLDIYDDRIAVTSPGGMYSGQQVQDVPLEDISSLRRNPVLADVMAQLDYMEKRGSGLKRICNETKALEAYKDDRRPVFKSSPSQFMTIIYSVDYKDAGQDTGQDTGNVTKQSLSWDQVGTKLGLSRDQVEKLLLSAIKATSAAEIRQVKATSAAEIRQVMNMTNATKFKRNYIDPLLELRILAMTQPDSPKSPTQKYYLTELGKQLIEK